MRRAGICLWMMLKRMGKHPVYWILLLLFPAAVLVVPGWNEAVREEQISVGYAVGESDGEHDELLAGIEDKLSEAETFRYIRYADAAKMREDILRGELSCGVYFDEAFSRKLREQDYHHCITLYLPEGMNVGGIVQEDLFGRVYQVYSAVWYAELLRGQGCQTNSEQVLQKFSEYQKEGKVFAVNYEVYRRDGNEVQNDSEGGRGASVLSLRGILAFLTFMSAVLGALDSARDKAGNFGKGIGVPGRLAMAAAGAPILPAALLLAAGMAINNVTSVSETAGEFAAALLYGFVLWLFAMAVGRTIPAKWMEGAAPCILLIVLLCCPVLFDLGETVPLIGYISNLFPITWYLKAWG